MGAEYDMYYNLAERIDNAFTEIDSDTCADLRKNNSEYAEMQREIIRLQEDFPVIPQIMEGDVAISLSAEEHKALARYLRLKTNMENMERKQIYFRGSADNFHYLKKIGAI